MTESRPHHIKDEDVLDDDAIKGMDLEPIDGFHSDLLQDPHHIRKDCQLISQAARERWPITEEKRVTLVDVLMKMAENSPKERHILSAARALMGMDLANVAAGTPQPTQVQQTNVQVNVSGRNPINELIDSMDNMNPVLPVGMQVKEG